MQVNTDQKSILEILNRGVIKEFLPSREDFLKALLSGQRLRFYIGADPTSNTLHLSHAKNYMLLEEFRKLGHEVIVLFGDFTARIGDPSGRKDARPQLSKQQVRENVREWKRQIKPLMDFGTWKNPPKVLYNSSWLEKLHFGDIVRLASNFTVQQMLERDMFQKRLRDGNPVHLHEFLYPLMQGYDSVAMDVDVELCGTDQIFNALAGRVLQKRIHNKDKFVVAVNLMENPKTGELMSKSRGTGVFLSSPPDEMFGAIMAQPDEMIDVLFINNTRIPLSEKDRLMSLGPRNAKARIAKEIVRTFYGERSAEKAAKNFDKQFSKKELPDTVEEAVVHAGGQTLPDLLVEADLAPSKSEARRLIAQGAVRVNQQKVSDENARVQHGDIVQVGKLKLKKIIFRIGVKKKKSE